MSSTTCYPLRKPERPLVLYGRGQLGQLAQDYLKVVGQEVAAVIERDEPANYDTCVAVSVVTSPYVPIERTLLNRGFAEVMPFYDLTEHFREKHPLANGWFAPNFTKSDKLNITSVLNSWADDVSRAHHLQFLAWRRLRQEWTFEWAGLCYWARYFIPEVTDVLHDHEVFVDGGAHHGKSTHDFIYSIRGQFKKIIAIEPDAANRDIYERSFKEERIKVWTCALAEHEGIVNFHDGLGYASQISPTGHRYVVTYPLDALDTEPTFVKFHLEGGELSALRGARRTLIRYRPIVAVTVYHNEDGMWAIPSYLMWLLNDYEFYFRLHSWCGTGAVVYAIPKERHESCH